MSLGDLKDIDITQLRLLASLADNRNLSSAAAKIGLSQSAASHALTRLRRRLGDPLIVRGANGFQPTPYGEKICAAARLAMNTLLDGLAANPLFEPETTTRRFNIYLNDIGQMIFLPKLLRFMNEKAPKGSIKIHQIPTEHPGLQLASGEIDLAVGFFNNLTAGFRQSLLYRVEYVCVARENHPAFKSGMSLEAFLQTPHAVADPSGMAHSVIEQSLGRLSPQRFVSLTVPNYVVIPALIVESDLLVVMPNGLAKAFSAHMPLKIMPSPVPLPSYDLNVYWHERFDHEAANRWLRQAFVSLFRRRAVSTSTSED